MTFYIYAFGWKEYGNENHVRVRMMGSGGDGGIQILYPGFGGHRAKGADAIIETNSASRMEDRKEGHYWGRTRRSMYRFTRNHNAGSGSICPSNEAL